MKPLSKRHAGAILIAMWLIAVVHAAGAFNTVVPLGLPAVPVPDRHPVTPARTALGRLLFFDTRLSVDNTVSCGSCHRPEHYFADPVPLSKGVRQQTGEHNTPSLLNAAYFPQLMWDGRSASLEDQVRYPVTHPREMSHTESAVVAMLRADAKLAAAFREAFGDDLISWERVAIALAAFERTLVSGNSPFDRFVAGDSTAISDEAQRGRALFEGRAGCGACHTYSRERPFFSDFGFHNTGAGWRDPPNLGRYSVTRLREDKGAFRTPSLRNVAETAPYMHDGGLASLPDVVEFYDRGGGGNPFLDERMRPIKLSPSEKRELVAFLTTLTGNVTFEP